MNRFLLIRQCSALIAQVIELHPIPQSVFHDFYFKYALGWVCYAEKTSQQALPYISTAKSSQQIIGSIFKNLLLPLTGYMTLANTFHVAVMPCFDKKLEATRKVFLKIVFLKK
jgi:hypothetical protein